MEQPLTRSFATDGSVVSLALEQALRSWEGLIEILPVGVCAFDSAGGLVRYNQRAAELWGRWPALDERRPYFGGALNARHTTERLPLDEDPIHMTLTSGAPVRRRELRLERTDKRSFTALIDVEPLFDAAGQVVGAIACFHEAADNRVGESERRARELLDALPAAIYTTDAAGKIIFYNKAAIEMAGRRPTIGSDEWCVTWKLYTADGETLPHNECPMAQALKEGRPIRGVEAIAERPDGTRVPFLPYPTPLHDDTGAVIGAVNMLVDITELKQSQTQQRVLVDELNHRVKNTLASVQSIAGHTLRGAGVAAPVRKTFDSRLFALSTAHDQLSQQRWESADLKTIVEAIFAPYGSEIGDRILLEGDPVKLTPQIALTLSMVLNELAINAQRHGCLTAAEGKLSVRWRIKPTPAGPHLAIEWIEAGGPEVMEPKSYGFGSRILQRGVAGQLRGQAKLDFSPAGVRCMMEIPLAPNGS